jgi:hypothetical protein
LGWIDEVGVAILGFPVVALDALEPGKGGEGLRGGGGVGLKPRFLREMDGTFYRTFSFPGS